MSKTILETKENVLKLHIGCNNVEKWTRYQNAKNETQKAMSKAQSKAYI